MVATINAETAPMILATISIRRRSEVRGQKSGVSTQHYSVLKSSSPITHHSSLTWPSHVGRSGAQTDRGHGLPACDRPQSSQRESVSAIPVYLRLELPT